MSFLAYWECIWEIPGVGVGVWFLKQPGVGSFSILFCNPGNILVAKFFLVFQRRIFFANSVTHLYYIFMHYFCKSNFFLTFLVNLYLFFSQTYGSAPSKAQLKDTGSLCPICQDDFVIPTMLQCKHIFCEQCVAKWFDRERTCPMCRTKVADDPSYRDGGTSHSVQLF